ncbi:tetratricopeptide repeat protein [Nibricoccus sp. IMCC34717]|uniref:tetratricopeptide repeat protein n=1 Tax=Nibricoccus sp. IMCC34717 TaxID=3034021 RepID=UPI00384BA16F
MSPEEIQSAVDEATFDFTIGDVETALAKLHQTLAQAPASFEAWHALAEIQLQRHDNDAALAAAERAHQLRPDDLFINTTLSRIWVAKGDKETAEKFGAQAKMLSWKDQLKNPSDYQGGL